MTQKQPFRITGSHLLTILNNQLFRERIKQCDWRIEGIEKGFEVKQSLYSHDFKVGSLIKGDEGSVKLPSSSGKLRKDPYLVIDVHSHYSPGEIFPSIGSGDDSSGDLNVAWLIRGAYKSSEINLKVNPIGGILGMPKDRSIPMLLVQEARPVTDLDMVLESIDIYEKAVRESISAVEALQYQGVWKAMTLEIPMDGLLGMEYESKLDKFSFTPEVVGAR